MSAYVISTEPISKSILMSYVSLNECLIKRMLYMYIIHIYNMTKSIFYYDKVPQSNH